MAIERKDGYPLVLLLPSVGLFSGLITSGLIYTAGRLGIYTLGAVFGVCIAASLSACGILREPWKGICLAIGGAAAYCFSIFVAAAVEISLPGQDSSMGQLTIPSPRALFAGGFVGGFLVLGGILILVHPQIGIRTIAMKAFAWSAIGGVLGILGWKLGSSLGMTVWSGVQSLGLTAPDETFQNALHGETSHQSSLFVVWQTGMALVLAVMLRRYRSKSTGVV